LGKSVGFELPEGPEAARPVVVDEFMARLPGRPQRIALVLGPEEYLLRRTTLPRAARDNLAEAVGYQLPQLTPFSASQLIYACGEAADSPSEGPLSVWLVAVPRQRVSRALALIGQTPPEGYLPLRDSPSPGAPVELAWRLPGRRAMNSSTTTGRVASGPSGSSKLTALSSAGERSSKLLPSMRSVSVVLVSCQERRSAAGIMSTSWLRHQWRNSPAFTDAHPPAPAGSAGSRGPTGYSPACG
jgi:hypothetical protein